MIDLHKTQPIFKARLHTRRGRAGPLDPPRSQQSHFYQVSREHAHTTPHTVSVTLQTSGRGRALGPAQHLLRSATGRFPSIKHFLFGGKNRPKSLAITQLLLRRHSFEIAITISALLSIKIIWLVQRGMVCVREQTALSYTFGSCEAASRIIAEPTGIARDERASNVPGFWLYLGRALGLVAGDGAFPLATQFPPATQPTS